MSDFTFSETNTSKNNKHKRSVELDDLVTPYFRKSVSYIKSRSDDVIELRINDYLESMGVYFIEQGHEAVYHSLKKNSVQAVKEASENQTVITEVPANESRLSGLNLDSNGLFLRRKLSSMRTSKDSL